MANLTPAVYNGQLNWFQNESARDGRFYQIDQLPCLEDIDKPGDYCPIYLYHTAWAARVLMRTKPEHHIDVGSLLYFVGVASAICPMTFCDIRPVLMPIPGITTLNADITHLPFITETVKSLSSLHVMEHVGLGRYGDALDAQGDLKAAAELMRVLAPGGQLLMVLPVGHPRVVFNAHRIYSYGQVLQMFAGLVLEEFTLVELPRYIVNADPERVKHLTEGAGCFWFTKPYPKPIPDPEPPVEVPPPDPRDLRKYAIQRRYRRTKETW